MEQLFLFGLFGLTSAGACAIGIRWLGLPATGLRSAAGKAVEALGMSLIFAGLNLATGTAVVLGVRGLGGFISAYVLLDAAWLSISLLQGLTFQCWRQCRGS